MPFHYKSESEIKSPDFVIISVRMVRTKSALVKRAIFLVRLKVWEWGPLPHFQVSARYMYMPHTSSGGQFLGFEIDRSRGKRKIRQKKAKEEKN